MATSDTDERWDAIVVGSGMGGLTCAAYLAVNGQRTLVLEKNAVAGGCSQVFRRRTHAGVWEFDVGVHYVGQCHATGNVTTVLRGLGLDGVVQWRELDPDGYATLVFPELSFRVPRGWDTYLGRLIETFPDEERGLRRCVGLFRRIADELRPGLPDNPAMIPVRAPLTVLGSMITLQRLFKLCRLSLKAQAVLAGENGDYACPPSRTAVAYHAAFLAHYLDGGGYYPEGGGQVLAGRLIEVIRSHGGAVYTNATVQKIVVTDGRVSGVHHSGGRIAHAPVVVSNADIKRTFLELVGREHLKARTVRRYEKARMALPLFSVYVGLDIDLNGRLPNSTYWAFPSYDMEAIYGRLYDGGVLDRVPIFMTSATLKDPGNSRSWPAGHSTLEIMTLVPPDYPFWSVTDGPAGGKGYGREPGYQEAKQRLTEAVIDAATEFVPDLREHIVFVEASTPITQERFTGSSGGACYGMELAIDQTGPRRPTWRTEVPGLYLTGASTTYTHGIGGTIFGGMYAAGAVLGRNLHAELRDGAVFADVTRLSVDAPDWDPLAASRPRAKATSSST